MNGSLKQQRAWVFCLAATGHIKREMGRGNGRSVLRLWGVGLDTGGYPHVV